ncbi:MAG: hypothetical protein P8K82_07655 [Paracoccaceae bacterium]|nr:hypothetical protein [Paracoccaceae bacterium]
MMRRIICDAGTANPKIFKCRTITRAFARNGTRSWTWGLSQNEKDVFYAVQSVIAGSDGVARSDDIKGHSLVFEMTQPTFHRSLKNLLDRGLLAHAPSTKAGSYVATEPENRQLEAVASI